MKAPGRFTGQGWIVLISKTGMDMTIDLFSAASVVAGFSEAELQFLETEFVIS